MERGKKCRELREEEKSRLRGKFRVQAWQFNHMDGPIQIGERNPRAFLHTFGGHNGKRERPLGKDDIKAEIHPKIADRFMGLQQPNIGRIVAADQCYGMAVLRKRDGQLAHRGSNVELAISYWKQQSESAAADPSTHNSLLRQTCCAPSNLLNT